MGGLTGSVSAVAAMAAAATATAAAAAPAALAAAPAATATMATRAARVGGRMAAALREARVGGWMAAAVREARVKGGVAETTAAALDPCTSCVRRHRNRALSLSPSRDGKHGAASHKEGGEAIERFGAVVCDDCAVCKRHSF